MVLSTRKDTGPDQGCGGRVIEETDEATFVL